MRKGGTVFSLVLVLLIVAGPSVQGSGSYTLYVPVMARTFDHCDPEGFVGNWFYVEAVETTNLVENPSFEVNLTGWAVGAHANIARASQASKFGVWSMFCNKTAGADTNCGSYAITLTAVPHTVSAWLQVDPTFDGTQVTLQAENFAGATGTLSADADLTETEMQKVSFTFTPNAGDLVGNIVLRLVGVAAFPKWTYIDGVQVEAQSEETTYCDGTQEGCEWLGTEHDSTSRRSAQSRAGGFIRDFEDLNFEISGMFGAGMSPVTNLVDSFALLPGGELDGTKTNERVFTIAGWIRGTSLQDLHSKRQAIINVMKPNAVAENQPVTLRYDGAAVEKQIDVHYEAGLGGNIRASFPCLEQNFAMRVLAPDPNFREIGESSAILDTNDSATMRTVSARLRDTGQWDALGPPAAPGIAVYGTVHAIVKDVPNLTYIGGTFTNFDNQANADNIVSWDGTAYSSLGTGCNDIVFQMIFMPDGNLIAGGLFTLAGGVANTRRVANWDGAVWTPLATGFANGQVESLAVSPSGVLYAGGSFTIAGGSAGDRVAFWNGAAWAPLAGGGFANGTVSALAFDSQGNLYAGGSFTVGGGSPADYFAIWDTTGWAAVDTGAGSGQVQTIAIESDDSIFIGGNFGSWNGDANQTGISHWNGTAWNSLDTGLNSAAFELRIAPDGKLYVVGSFTTAGDVDVADRMAVWNGSSWTHLDINLPGAPSVFALEIGSPDPVIQANYDVWIGWQTTGTSTFAGDVTVNNGGTEDAFPVIEISRTGGTSAKLTQIRNETLGLLMSFDYDLLDGETLTIDLSPTVKSITSSFFGAVPGAILANSDFGEWRLQSGENLVTVYVDVGGGPTINGHILYQDQFWSFD